jgi:hypothetical protein
VTFGGERHQAPESREHGDGLFEGSEFVGR